jgi:hypothetical protein
VEARLEAERFQQFAEHIFPQKARIPLQSWQHAEQ